MAPIAYNPAADLEAEVDATIAACDGDTRAAVRSLVVMVCLQEHQIEELASENADLRTAISRGYARGRFQMPSAGSGG